MKTIILIQQSIHGMNLVSMVRESSSELLNGTFKSWLENNWGHLTWEHSNGEEGSDSIEYKSGNYTANYTRIMDGDMNDENTYSPMRDDSLTFIEEVVPMAEKDEEYDFDDEEDDEDENERMFKLTKRGEKSIIAQFIMTPNGEEVARFHFGNTKAPKHSIEMKGTFPLSFNNQWLEEKRQEGFKIEPFCKYNMKSFYAPMYEEIRL